MPASKGQCFCGRFAAVTEAAALAAADWMGRGDGLAADLTAREAMAAELARMPIKARVVAGRGGSVDMSALQVAASVGSATGPWFTSSMESDGAPTDDPEVWDLAVDPLQAPKSLARGTDGAMAVVAAGSPGSLMYVPEMYMQKLVVPTQAAGALDLDAAVGDTVRAVASALGRRADDLVVVVLDRARHEELVEQIRSTGARVRLVGDGDVSAGVAVASGDAGVDMCIGIGGSTEGILTAVALRCLGGEMLGRLWPVSRHQVELVRAAGIEDIEARLTTGDMAGEGVLLSATAVTGGRFLKAVQQRPDGIYTETLVLCSRCHAIRKIQTIHRSKETSARVSLGAR